MKAGIDAEMLALGNLALGFKAEITDWNGEWWANDIIEFKLSFGAWEPSSHRFEYKLDAFQDKERKGTPVLLRSGPLAGESPRKEEEDSQVYELSLTQRVDDALYQSVRLTFSIYKDGDLVGTDALWATSDD